jgi:hypothetical protein
VSPIPPSIPLYFDDFSDSNSGWPKGIQSVSSGFVVFTSGSPAGVGSPSPPSAQLRGYADGSYYIDVASSRSATFYSSIAPYETAAASADTLVFKTSAMIDAAKSGYADSLEFGLLVGFDTASMLSGLTPTGSPSTLPPLLQTPTRGLLFLFNQHDQRWSIVKDVAHNLEVLDQGAAAATAPTVLEVRKHADARYELRINDRIVATTQIPGYEGSHTGLAQLPSLSVDPAMGSEPFSGRVQFDWFEVDNLTR